MSFTYHMNLPADRKNYFLVKTGQIISRKTQRKKAIAAKFGISVKALRKREKTLRRLARSAQ